jgi:hypothetical protein
MALVRLCRRVLAVLGGAALCQALAAPAGAQGGVPRRPVPKPPVLRLEIEAPLPGEVVGAREQKLLVSGRALSSAVRGGNFEVIAIVDTSSSTSAPSGADVDGDGVVGRSRIPGLGPFLQLASSDPGDSVLAAEVAAARTLLGQLDPYSTRVGVVAFAGDGRDPTPDASVVAPLTDRYADVHAALDRLLEAGPRGRTNIYASVVLAARELLGGEGALSKPRPLARRVALLMSDGQPTLPVASSRRECARMAVEAARQAGELGIRIDTFAIGAEAADGPYVTREIASATSGVFTAVREPGDLVAAFQDIRLADITGLEIRNLTTRHPAEQVRLDSDGWFAGIVGLARGRNRIEIRAYASDGRRIIRVVDAQRLEGGKPQKLSPQLEARRTRMLERRLDHTRSRTLELEAQKADRQREALAAEMRAKRSRRTRELEIEAESAVPASPAK